MSTTLAASCCPECGCSGLIEGSRGLTCTTCGLVLDETPSFVVHDQRGKEGIIASHAILHGNTTTMVGKPSERGIGNASSLSRAQQRVITYGDSKRSRVHHLVSGVVATAQLPAIVVDHAMHVHGKLAAIAPRGSSMAGCGVLAALSTFIACKRLAISQPRDDLLDMLATLDVDARLFQRNLLRLRAIGKRLGGTAARNASIANAVLAALRDVLGPGSYIDTVSLVHVTLAKALVGMREDSAAAVTAFLSLNLLVPRGGSLTALAKALRFRPASLYNATKRVLGKIGIVVEGPLSRANLGAVLQSRVAIDGGIVKEAPVAIVSPAIVPAGVPSTPVVAMVRVQGRPNKRKITRRSRGLTSKRSMTVPFIIFTSARRPRSRITRPRPVAWWQGAPGPPGMAIALRASNPSLLKLPVSLG
jgi:hypothetical protein